MAKGLMKYSDEFVMSKIHVIRGQKVMLDSDLGPLFNVEVKRLKEQVRRNIERFPEDFMFELTQEEATNLRSQIATSSHGGARYLPMAFTEHGVLMLSNVLRSERAVLMSIQVIRVFTRMREMLLTHKDLLLELEKLRNTSKEHGGNPGLRAGTGDLPLPQADGKARDRTRATGRSGQGEATAGAGLQGRQGEAVVNSEASVGSPACGVPLRSLTPNNGCDPSGVVVAGGISIYYKL